MKIKKGDKIKVITGKDKNLEGKVEKVYSSGRKILVLNINTYKKHIKKNEKMPQGGRVDLPRPINISKVMLVCPKCNKKTRVGYLVEKSKKYRICKKCGSKI